MNGLKPIKMPSAKEKVAAELRKAILSRQMQEGEVLSLDSVATQLNVSAMPVREAFQILARDGLIQLRKNKGAVRVVFFESRFLKNRSLLFHLHVLLLKQTAVKINRMYNPFFLRSIINS